MPTKNPKTYKTAKQRTRERVVQALYQWQVSGEAIMQIEAQFLQQKNGKISKRFFSDLLINITKNTRQLDELIAPLLDNRSLKELGAVEHSVLYLGAYELQFSPEVPYKVVINEAVGLAQLYGAQDAYKLINTTLDALAKSLRSAEIQA